MAKSKSKPKPKPKPKKFGFMPPAPLAAARATGAKRMREFGYKRVDVWFDKSEYETVLSAAIKDGRPLATYVRRAAHQAAVSAAT